MSDSSASQVEIQLPDYVTPPAAWRRRIHSAAAAALAAHGVAFGAADKLAVDVELCMTTEALRFHDVDNRLKDVMDALQGRVGGTKSKKAGLPPLIPNDWQVFEARVRKSGRRAGVSGGGRLIIRPFSVASAV